MTAEMVAPAWMQRQISAEQYASWSEEQCAGVEIMDGMVVVRPSASKRHNRLARILANALDTAAGPDWNADTDFDVRLQDVPLSNRRPDVIVYRAETLDLTPTRPEHVLLVVEVVSPGSETTDRIVKVDQYAKAGIPFYWRIEQSATGVPIVYTYVLDPATKAYRDGEMFTGTVKAIAPFSITVDLVRNRDDPVLPGGGRIVGRARLSRRCPEQPSERIGEDLDAHSVAFVFPGVVRGVGGDAVDGQQAPSRMTNALFRMVFIASVKVGARVARTSMAAREVGATVSRCPHAWPSVVRPGTAGCGWTSRSRTDRQAREALGGHG